MSMGKQIYYRNLRNDDPDTIRSHIMYLTEQHKLLKEAVKQGRSHFLDDAELGKMKQQKLIIKRQIAKYETKLKEITGEA
jgi:hypothetical protein